MKVTDFFFRPAQLAGVVAVRDASVMEAPSGDADE